MVFVPSNSDLINVCSRAALCAITLFCIAAVEPVNAATIVSVSMSLSAASH
jgi:hypothetical protein